MLICSMRMLCARGGKFSKVPMPQASSAAIGMRSKLKLTPEEFAEVAEKINREIA